MKKEDEGADKRENGVRLTGRRGRRETRGSRGELKRVNETEGIGTKGETRRIGNGIND